jgi:ABC-type thiamine transport system ATPase subunit
MKRTVPDLIATIALLDRLFMVPDDETRTEIYQLLRRFTADGAIATQQVTHRQQEAWQPTSRGSFLNATVIHQQPSISHTATGAA